MKNKQSQMLIEKETIKCVSESIFYIIYLLLSLSSFSFSSLSLSFHHYIYNYYYRRYHYYHFQDYFDYRHPFQEANSEQMILLSRTN